MPAGNPGRLLTLADREFRDLIGKPATIAPSRKLKPIKLNAAKFEMAGAASGSQPCG
jgi:hypothetical protein